MWWSLSPLLSVTYMGYYLRIHRVCWFSEHCKAFLGLLFFFAMLSTHPYPDSMPADPTVLDSGDNQIELQ